MSAQIQPPSRLLRAVIGATLCLGLLLPAAAVQAASLSATLTDTATDGCRRAAEAAGYSVDQVVSAKQGLGDRSNVVLQLSKGQERFEFSCGYNEALRKLPALSTAPATAPALRRDAPTAAVTARSEASRLDASRVEASRIAPQPTARQEHEQRTAAREQARLDRRSERQGIPLLAWFLPLLLLPLFALLMRRPEDEMSANRAAAPSTPRTMSAPVTVISNPLGPP